MPNFPLGVKLPEGCVYILGSTTGTLYTGVTSNFDRRFFEHKNGIKLWLCSEVPLQPTPADRAPHRHPIRNRSRKGHQGLTRAKKLALIAQLNPEFKDLGWQMLHPQQKIADHRDRH